MVQLAHTRAGSARQPPKRTRCTAAMSQQVATRTPALMSGTAVSFDHHTHRGRSASSTRPTTTEASSAPDDQEKAPEAVAIPSPTPGA